MTKINFNNYYTDCPYGFTLGSIRSSYNSNQPVYLTGICPECKYHIKKVYNNSDKINGYILCKYKNFSDKIKMIKGLINEI